MEASDVINYLHSNQFEDEKIQILLKIESIILPL